MDLFNELNKAMNQYNKRIRKTKTSPKTEWFDKLTEAESKSAHISMLRHHIISDFKKLEEMVGEVEAQDLLKTLMGKPF